MQPSHAAGDVVVLGRVRSAKVYRKGVKHAFPIYKKHFWVARETGGLLEYFKNDQDPQAKGSISAAQIKAVSFASDKQNKFFDLCVELRGDVQRRFRFSSREERARWYDTLTAFAAQHSSKSQWHSILNVVHRHLAAASATAPYTFTAELEGISDIRSDKVQYCVEAIDIGVDFARLVAQAFTSTVNKGSGASGSGSHMGDDEDDEDKESMGVPFASVNLVLMSHTSGGGAAASSSTVPTASGGGAAGPVGSSSSHTTAALEEANACEIERLLSAGTRYDPSTKQLILTLLLCEEGGDMHFKHMPLHRVVAMLRSTVWRNPVIEGWLSQDKQTQQELQMLSNLIHGNGSAGPLLQVTMQWGHDVDGVDEIQLEEYLNEHVSFVLMQELRVVIAQLMEEFPDVLAPGSEPHLTLLPSARECFRAYLVGVGIHLDRATLESRRRPSVEVLHSMWNDKSLNTSTIVASKFKRLSTSGYRVAALRNVSVQQVLRDELLEMLWIVRLGHAFSHVDQRLSAAVGTRDGCSVSWEAFGNAVRALCSTQVDLSALAVTALCFGDFYLPRIERLTSSLRQTPARGTMPLSRGSTTLAEVFQKCVSTVVVDFVIAADDGSGGMQAASSTIRSGILTDVVILWCANHIPARPRDEEMRPIRLDGPCDVAVSYSIVQLSAWIRGYFSNPRNIVPYHTDKHAQQEDDNSSSSDDDEYEGQLDFGNAVANERKVETQVLSLAHVVSFVYDSQEGLPVQLKVGANVIQEAMDALQRVFDSEGTISKHILLRILTSNLQRLRELFVRSSLPDDIPLDDDATFSSLPTALAPLTRGAAHELLCSYCEYAETESVIGSSLDTVESLRRCATRSFHAEMVSRSASPQQPMTAVERASTNPTTAQTRRLEAPPPSAPRQRREVEPGSHESSQPEGPTLASQQPSLSSSNLKHPSWRPTAAPVRHSSGVGDVDEVSSASGVLGSQRQLSSSAMSSPFDFEAVAAVGLCALLPREARLACRCRRDILWVGLENVGKTLIINTMRGVAQPTHPTVGLTESVIAYEDWVCGCKELGGRVDFRKNFKQYLARIEHVHAAVFVVDSGKPTSFPEAAEYLKEVSRRLTDIPFLVIFNNYRPGDRRAPKPDFLYDSLDLRHVSNSHELQYCLCDVTVVHSAHRTVHPNVGEGLSWICSVWRRDAPEAAAVPKHCVIPATGNTRETTR